MHANRSLPAVVACAGFAMLAIGLALAAGQPLITDDAWLHLALGRAYAAAGPWLDTDPLLARSLGPPTPAAWLFDVALYEIERATGFTGLRVVHVGLVVAVLALAWSQLRRASGSVVAASLACSLFATLAAYRLIQLRPHLLSILAALALYRLLLDRDAPLSRGRIAVGVLLLGAWANVHAAFVLGPLLIGTAFVALLVTLPGRGPEARAEARPRLAALAAAGAFGLVATLLNPSGIRPHLAWFVSGSETPSLGRVADEWVAFDPFTAPLPGLPPSDLTFGIQWILMIATAAALVYAIGSGRRAPRDASDAGDVDPALVGLALVSIALPLVAVRFLWLGIFPLLLVSRAGASWLARRPGVAGPTAWAGALAVVLVLVAFFLAGPWRMMRGTVPTTVAGYRQPYPAGKYHGHLIWMIRDAGLSGTAFADYHVAAFAGAHLAPEIRMLVNGTLNVPADVINANLPLRERRGEREGERFVDLLDRHRIDMFLGIRIPHVRDTARPFFHSTAHLERTPGWIVVFRNIAGAVYLRDDERNRENLERVAAWYRQQEVPFDPDAGFDVERVVREERRWAIQHGMIPVHFDQLTRSAYGNEPDARLGARTLLASIYAALGLYEHAVELDRARVDANPDAFRARRRLVWSLLRLDRGEEAAVLTAPLGARPEQDGLSRHIAAMAVRAAAATDEETRASLVARLPVFDLADVAALTARIVLPAARPPPD